MLLQADKVEVEDKLKLIVRAQEELLNDLREMNATMERLLNA